MNKERFLSERFQVGQKQITFFLLVVTVSAFLLRLTVAYATVHHYDLNYYIDWSTGVSRDLFGAYEHISSLDYPPLFLFPLVVTGKLLLLVGDTPGLQMLVLKGWQVLFDTAMIPLIFMILRRESRLIAAAGAALWAVNPTIIVNSSYWGQTDSIMLFLLALSFWLLMEQRPVTAGVVMALACLMKFQSLYFLPVFALFLLAGFSFQKIALAAGAGAMTVLAVFMPFMAHSGWRLPFVIYFGGYAQYQDASLNAFNYFTACGMNLQNSNEVLLGGITADMLSTAVIGISLFLLAFLFFTATEKSPWLLSFLFIQTIFMFTTRMHERYQIPAVLFALLACLHHRSKSLFVSYLGITVMTFFNHVIVLEHMLSGREASGFYQVLCILFAFINLFIYSATVFFSVRLLYRYGRFRFTYAFQCALPGRWHKREGWTKRP